MWRISAPESLTTLRLRYIQYLAIFSMIFALIGIIILAVSGIVTALPQVLLPVIAYIAANGVLLVLVQRKQLLAATIVLTTVYVVATIGLDVNTPWVLVTAAVAIMSAAALGDRTLFVATNIVVMGRLIFQLLVIAQQGPAGIPPEAEQIIVLVIALLLVSGFTRYFVDQTEEAALAAQNSSHILQSVAEAGQELAKNLDVEKLLPQSVDLIRDRFGFYHVQIFLVDEEGTTARLYASTGAIGEKLLERGHQLPVGSQSVIGRTTRRGEPVLARDTDEVYYRNELLPETRAELALPMTDGDHIIGALDIQSRTVDAFTPETIQALQVMANLLATSIRNARLFEIQERNARETKRLFLEAESNLREIQRMNQQLTRSGWDSFLKDQRRQSGVTMNEEMLQPGSEWTETLVKAAESRKPVTEWNGQQSVIAVPVILGGEVIGAIEVEPDQQPDEDTVETVQAVAQRLAISLDKARLFEETQASAAQEQRINEIVARYQTITNVDDLLRVTLSELSQSLGAKRGAIRLGAVQSMNGDGVA
jgi:GAF domain-containing protein